MPSSNSLDVFVLAGYTYRLFETQYDAPAAHNILLNFTGVEILTLEQIQVAWQRFHQGKFQMRDYPKLALMQNNEFSKAGLLNFLVTMDGSYESVMFDCLRNITNNEKFRIELDFINSFWKRYEFGRNHQKELRELEKDFNLDSLHGYLMRTYIERLSVRKAFSQLGKLPGEMVMSKNDVKEFYERMKRGEFIKQEIRKKLWLPRIPTVPQTMILRHLDMESRLAIRQTCLLFHDLVKALPLQIDRLEVVLDKNYIQVFTHPDVFKIELDEHPKGVVVGQNQSFTYEDNYQKKWKNWVDYAKLGMNWIAKHPNLVIHKFQFTNIDRANRAASNPFRMNRHQNLLNVENVYIKTNIFSHVNDILASINPNTIKGIYLLHPTHYDLANCRRLHILRSWILNGWEQWMRADVLITNSKVTHFLPYRFHEHVVHFNCAKFRAKRKVTRDQVMWLKERYLERPEFRELKMLCSMTDDEYDTLNIELETYNSRDIENPRWAHFPYPQPNQDKILSLCVSNGRIWFKGPCYIPGETDFKEENIHDGKKREVVKDNTMTTEEECENCQWLEIASHWTFSSYYLSRFTLWSMNKLVELMTHNYDFGELQIEFNFKRIGILPEDLKAIHLTYNCVNKPDAQRLRLAFKNFSVPNQHEGFMFCIIGNFLWFIGPECDIWDDDDISFFSRFTLTESQTDSFFRKLRAFRKRMADSDDEDEIEEEIDDSRDLEEESANEESESEEEPEDDDEDSDGDTEEEIEPEEFEQDAPEEQDGWQGVEGEEDFEDEDDEDEEEEEEDIEKNSFYIENRPFYF